MSLFSGSKYRMSSSVDETVRHLVAGCQKVAGVENLQRHNKVTAMLHKAIRHHYGVTIADKPWLNKPEVVIDTDKVKIEL